jgi:putative transposase
MDFHLGDEAEADNTRNGYGRKTVSTATGYASVEGRA